AVRSLLPYTPLFRSGDLHVRVTLCERSDLLLQQADVLGLLLLAGVEARVGGVELGVVPGVYSSEASAAGRCLAEGLLHRLAGHRSEEHTSELQSRFD